MKSAADTVKETSRKLMDYHLGTGRLPDWNDLFQGFSAAQELLAEANAQPKLWRVQRAWFKDQQSGKTVEIIISSDAQVDWLGVNELLIRGCSKPWVRVAEDVTRAERFGSEGQSSEAITSTETSGLPARQSGSPGVDPSGERQFDSFGLPISNLKIPMPPVKEPKK